MVQIVDNFSAYRFKNHMQYLKKKIRCPNLVLQQLNNRICEEQIRVETKKNKNSRIHHKFDDFEIDAKLESNKLSLIDNKQPEMVNNFFFEDGETYALGHRHH